MYSRLQEAKLSLLPKIMPLESEVSLYQSFYLMDMCSILCGWASPLLGTLRTCIQPVVYQHHMFCSAKLSSTLLSSSPHWGEELFCHRCKSLHLPLLNWIGCLPVEMTLASHPSSIWVASSFPLTWCYLCTSWGNILYCFPGCWWRY